METIHIKDQVKDLIQKIREKKEARMAFFYSVFYFVFITALLVFGTTGRAQTPSESSPIKTAEWTINKTAQAISVPSINIVREDTRQQFAKN
jgi:hypothetical protein